MQEKAGEDSKAKKVEQTPSNVNSPLTKKEKGMTGEKSIEEPSSAINLDSLILIENLDQNATENAA